MARRERPADMWRWYAVTAEWHPEWGARREHAANAREAARAAGTSGPITVRTEATGEVLRFDGLEVVHG